MREAAMHEYFAPVHHRLAPRRSGRSIRPHRLRNRWRYLRVTTVIFMADYGVRGHELLVRKEGADAVERCWRIRLKR